MTLDVDRLIEGTTPGPWEVLSGANSHCFDMRIVGGDECIAFADGEAVDEDIVEPSPNAKLIAAAPDLARQCIALTAKITNLEKEMKRKKVFESIFAELDKKRGSGHGHITEGIWDNDWGNGERAGLPCVWCAQWEKARAALSLEEGSAPTAHGVSQ